LPATACRNTGDATDQDFALVCSNCVLAPTFTLSTVQRAPSVCVGANYDATVAVGAVDNFVAPVNLSLSGNPAGTSASVTPASATPPASASVSITGSGGVAAGHYPLVLTGSSGSIAKTLHIDLSYASSAPPAPVLAARQWREKRRLASDPELAACESGRFIPRRSCQ
jgi:hypothetical protein